MRRTIPPGPTPEFKRQMRNTLLYVAALVSALAVSKARAETYHRELPTSVIEPVKAMSIKGDLYRCVKKRMDARGTLRDVKGSRRVFATSLPASINADQFDAAIAEGSKPVKCERIAREGGKWVVVE